MLSPSRRHGIVGLLGFILLLVWVGHDLLLPAVGRDVTAFDSHLPSILRPGPNPNSKNHGGKHSHSQDDEAVDYGASNEGYEAAYNDYKNAAQKPINETLARFWSISSEDALSGVKEWKKPKNVKQVMGLVFYGRRETVSILDCYLKRNLVKNGGVLDGVIFVERTTDKNDLDLLNNMLESEPDYQRWFVDTSHGDGFAHGFGASYERIEDDVLYVKIDDDIVFIEDTTIPSLVETVVTRPDLYIVSANIVNQPMISWMHWNLGAVKPYLPDLDKRHTQPEYTEVDWRPSSLPDWRGRSDFSVSDWTAPERGCHRWLPIRGKKNHILDITPIVKTEYDAFGEGWKSWHIGAQEHYSLIENIEKNELYRYKFNLWDFQYERMGIQLIGMMGKDINKAKPIPRDDEDHFSCVMTKKLGRHGVSDGRGVAAHWAFGSQRGGMRTTDVLERYRGFARDKICASPMLWQSLKDDAH